MTVSLNFYPRVHKALRLKLSRYRPGDNCLNENNSFIPQIAIAVWRVDNCLNENRVVNCLPAFIKRIRYGD